MFVHRFLQVEPATDEDRHLLSHFLLSLTSLLHTVTTHTDTGCTSDDRQETLGLILGDRFLCWLEQQTMEDESVSLQTLQSLFQSREDKGEGER